MPKDLTAVEYSKAVKRARLSYEFGIRQRAYYGIRYGVAQLLQSTNDSRAHVSFRPSRLYTSQKHCKYIKVIWLIMSTAKHNEYEGAA